MVAQQPQTRHLAGSNKMMQPPTPFRSTGCGSRTLSSGSPPDLLQVVHTGLWWAVTTNSKTFTQLSAAWDHSLTKHLFTRHFAEELTMKTLKRSTSALVRSPSWSLRKTATWAAFLSSSSLRRRKTCMNSEDISSSMVTKESSECSSWTSEITQLLSKEAASSIVESSSRLMLFKWGVSETTCFPKLSLCIIWAMATAPSSLSTKSRSSLFLPTFSSKPSYQRVPQTFTSIIAWSKATSRIVK